jgi:hypothetical protein
VKGLNVKVVSKEGKAKENGLRAHVACDHKLGFEGGSCGPDG